MSKNKIELLIRENEKEKEISKQKDNQIALLIEQNKQLQSLCYNLSDTNNKLTSQIIELNNELRSLNIKYLKLSNNRKSEENKEELKDANNDNLEEEDKKKDNNVIKEVPLEEHVNEENVEQVSNIKKGSDIEKECIANEQNVKDDEAEGRYYYIEKGKKWIFKIKHEPKDSDIIYLKCADSSCACYGYYNKILKQFVKNIKPRKRNLKKSLINKKVFKDINENEPDEIEERDSDNESSDEGLYEHYSKDCPFKEKTYEEHSFVTQSELNEKFINLQLTTNQKESTEIQKKYAKFLIDKFEIYKTETIIDKIYNDFNINELNDIKGSQISYYIKAIKSNKLTGKTFIDKISCISLGQENLCMKVKSKYSINGNEWDILYFGTEKNFELLSNSENQFFIDTTYRCIPFSKIYKKLITLTCFDKESKQAQICCLILSENEKCETLCEIFDYLKTKWNFSPRYISCDYSCSLIKAILKSFDNVKIVGCLFHFINAILKKLKKLKLYNYRKKDEAKKIRINIELLAFISPDDIEHFLMSMKTLFNNDQSANWKLFKLYFNKTWINGYIKTSFWNYNKFLYDEDIKNEIFYTNNVAESLHRTLNKEIKKGRCNINLFISIIKEIFIKYKQRKVHRKDKNKLITHFISQYITSRKVKKCITLKSNIKSIFTDLTKDEELSDIDSNSEEGDDIIDSNNQIVSFMSNNNNILNKPLDYFKQYLHLKGGEEIIDCEYTSENDEYEITILNRKKQRKKVIINMNFE